MGDVCNRGIARTDAIVTERRVSDVCLPVADEKKRHRNHKEIRDIPQKLLPRKPWTFPAFDMPSLNDLLPG